MAINFKVVYLPENQGHGNARRKSLEECTNELVALMDSDDISFSNRFEKQLRIFIDTDNVDIVGGQITEFIGEPENITGKRVVPESDTDIKKFMKKRCPMNQVSVMFKKSFYDKVGGYIDWFCEEDYYLWLRMAEAGGVFANVPETLVNVRIGNAMSARRGGLKYFFSEAKIQKYMYSKRIISLPRFVYNVALRFGGEVIISDNMRTKLFKWMRGSGESMISECVSDIIDKREENDYPPFSVAMCVYGGDNAEWFDVALGSVVKQTVTPNEIVLVVDGPIPQTIQAIIKKYESFLCGSEPPK